MLLELADDMQKHFGKMDILTGREHEFLGMKIKIKDKKVEIDMSKQLREVVNTCEACGEIAPHHVQHHIFLLLEKMLNNLMKQGARFFIL